LGDAYDYTRDFGGARYLFCRGIDATRPDGPGIHAWRSDPDLVHALDALFAGQPQTAEAASASASPAPCSAAASCARATTPWPRACAASIRRHPLRCSLPPPWLPWPCPPATPASTLPTPGASSTPPSTGPPPTPGARPCNPPPASLARTPA